MMIEPVFQHLPYKQTTSDNFVLYLLEKAFKGKPDEHTRRLLIGCTTIEDVMKRIVETDLIRNVFLGDNVGLGNLGEFYVALRCEKEWRPRPGFDVWGAFEYHDMIEVGKIEVRTVRINNRAWVPKVTDVNLAVGYDVIVVIGLTDSYNPCDAKLFVIPGCVMRDFVEDALKRRKPTRVMIGISTNRYNQQSNELNKWYEYELIDHTRLGEQIAKYVHGDYQICSQQLPLPFVFT